MYDLALEPLGPDEEAMDTAVQIFHRYIKHKSGHAVTGSYLCRIGKAESDPYWECTSHA